jgi:hypothetical protein
MTYAWTAHRFKGRKVRRGQPRGKGKGRGKGGRHFFYGKGGKGKGKGKSKGKSKGKGYTAQDNQDNWADFSKGKGKGKKGKKGKDQQDAPQGDGKGHPNGKGKGYSHAVHDQDQWNDEWTWWSGDWWSTDEWSSDAWYGTDWWNQSSSWDTTSWQEGQSGASTTQPAGNTNQLAITDGTKANVFYADYYQVEHQGSAFAYATYDDSLDAFVPLEYSFIGKHKLRPGQEPIKVSENPTYVISDLGCTRAMGSRVAIEAFAKVAHHYGMTYEYLPTSGTFNFAKSQSTKCTEKIRIWFPTKPPLSTDFDIVEEGNVPMLLSLVQMQNLRFCLYCAPEEVLLSSPALGKGARPMEVSTSRHLVLNLADVKFSPLEDGNSRIVSSQDVDLRYPSFQSTEIVPPGVEESLASKRLKEKTTPSKPALPKVEVPPPPVPHEVERPIVNCPACRGLHRAHVPQCPKGRAATGSSETIITGEPTERMKNCRACKGAKESHSCEKGDPVPKGKKITFAPSQAIVPGVPSTSSGPNLQGENGQPELGSGQPSAGNMPAPQLGPETTQSEAEGDPTIPPALRKLHERLKKSVELYKLHVKHYHMTPSQFQKRTSQLSLPQEVYDKYTKVCKQCKICSASVPDPSSSKSQE